MVDLVLWLLFWISTTQPPSDWCLGLSAWPYTGPGNEADSRGLGTHQEAAVVLGIGNKGHGTRSF